MKIIITDRAVRWSFTTLRPAVLLWYIVPHRVQWSFTNLRRAVLRLFTNPRRAVLRLFISPHPVPESRGIAAEKKSTPELTQNVIPEFFYPDIQILNKFKHCFRHRQQVK